MPPAPNILVTDTGFRPDDWTGPYHPIEGHAAKGTGLSIHMAPEDDPDALAADLDRIAMIRIDFPSFADGRGFTLARRLRLAGFAGRLRASGHLIADQYAMARRAGFDEVEISGELARRQPEDQWRARADWQTNDYKSRLAGSR